MEDKMDGEDYFNLTNSFDEHVRAVEGYMQWINYKPLETQYFFKITFDGHTRPTTGYMDIVAERNNSPLIIDIKRQSKPAKKAKKELLDVIEKTSSNTRMTLTLALSYGSREEITSCFKQIAEKISNRELSIDAIDESVINEHLYTQNLPDVDLLIRTSGEQRISNFLLWQIAYAELYFTKILWPDYRREDLFEAIYNYQNRERRFGKTSEQLS